ncbi:hypothetical protein EW026_g5078 [Hermanssonia centrifuga]|uniref:Peroxisomal ATPase PEX6 n=1 Tax=Hermanssonia centrifuga TaxID=98765 RepID=A0A4V3XA59_9APHY|nr:hypothetical protein EW026_g5078 [Hermanssonia centrifuga]
MVSLSVDFNCQLHQTLTRYMFAQVIWDELEFSLATGQSLARLKILPTESSTGTISVSSMLHYNMVKDPSKLRSTRIEVLPTPFGSSRPAIPTARTVTIARIASPLSVDRAYQPLFLRKLHDYFNHHKRLVKQGDLIAVSLDTDVIGYSCHSEEDVAEGFAGIGVKDAVTSRHGLDFGCSNEIIFFMITNVECGGLPLDGHGGFYAGITAGEWGCWVDSAVTRIIQVGVEHSRVPDLTGYFGIDSTSSVDLNKPSQKLLTLTSAALTHGASEYHLQLSVILQGTRGVGKMTAAINVARQLGLHVLEINCYDMIGESDVQTEGFLRARFEKATTCSPCFFILRHIDSLAQTSQSSDSTKAPAVADILSECIESLQEAWALSGFPVIVIGITDHPDQASPQILACFKHTIVFEVPEEGERHVILESLVHDVPLAPDVSLKEIAVQTAALVASDIVDLVVRGQHASVQRVTQNSARDNSAGICTVGSLLASGDLEKALNKARASYSESIGAPKIPNVSWDDVGGLTSVKTDILDTIQLPLEHPELFSGGLKKRSGILLYGPPGTGKTLLAKAVATSCTLNFFSVKGPELLNMYIGESEANVRRVFQRARDAKPCVIFFDELDSVAPKRGNHGDSGGVMDRIVSQLLAELDGVAAGDAGADVFVIGATNRPDLLDSALLRPGRFDRMLYLGVSQTHEAQLNILQALTRKFKLDPELDLQRVAESCPFHYTGADFYALCSDALLKAMSRKAEELELKIAALNAEPADLRHPYPLTPQYFLAEMASSADIDVLVSQDDFDSALRELVPSVSQDEMEHYARVQRQFSRETINKS